MTTTPQQISRRRTLPTSSPTGPRTGLARLRGAHPFLLGVAAARLRRRAAQVILRW
jgi:hypothetical protein